MRTIIIFVISFLSLLTQGQRIISGFYTDAGEFIGPALFEELSLNSDKSFHYWSGKNGFIAEGNYEIKNHSVKLELRKIIIDTTFIPDKVESIKIPIQFLIIKDKLWADYPQGMLIKCFNNRNHFNYSWIGGKYWDFKSKFFLKRRIRLIKSIIIDYQTIKNMPAAKTG